MFYQHNFYTRLSYLQTLNANQLNALTTEQLAAVTTDQLDSLPTAMKDLINGNIQRIEESMSPLGSDSRRRGPGTFGGDSTKDDDAKTPGSSTSGLLGTLTGGLTGGFFGASTPVSSCKIISHKSDN